LTSPNPFKGGERRGLKGRYCSEYGRFRGVKKEKISILNTPLYLSEYLRKWRLEKRPENYTFK